MTIQQYPSIEEICDYRANKYPTERFIVTKSSGIASVTIDLEYEDDLCPCFDIEIGFITDTGIQYVKCAMMYCTHKDASIIQASITNAQARIELFNDILDLYSQVK